MNFLSFRPEQANASSSRFAPANRLACVAERPRLNRCTAEPNRQHTVASLAKVRCRGQLPSCPRRSVATLVHPVSSCALAFSPLNFLSSRPQQASASSSRFAPANRLAYAAERPRLNRCTAEASRQCKVSRLAKALCSRCLWSPRKSLYSRSCSRPRHP